MSEMDTPKYTIEQLEDMIPVVKTLAKMGGYTEPQAVQAIGYYMLLKNEKPADAETVMRHIRGIKAKGTGPMLTDKEARLMVALGHLQIKAKPFVASASKTGNNSPCPCGSGMKYKKCCKAMAQVYDFNVKEAQKLLP